MYSLSTMESELAVNIVTIKQLKKAVRHVKSIHDGVKHGCGHCNYKATQKNPLCIHVQSVHNVVKYSCDQCKYKAARKDHLHLLI